MHGLRWWTYFPHFWEVQCGNARTPMETFLDDDKFNA